MASRSTKTVPADKATKATTKSRTETSAAPARPSKAAAEPPATARSARSAAKTAGTRKPAAAAKTTGKTAAKSTTKTAAKTAAKTGSAKSAAKAAPARTAAGKSASKTASRTASKSATKTATKTASKTAATPAELKVRENESPWTAAELREVRTELEADVARLSTEIHAAETELAELLRDAGDGTGDDQADAGAKTFEREQEISLANNSREMLEQSQRALARIGDGTYGVCESCGQPVGKMRLQAFPRATLCVSCKQQQERR